MSGTGGRTRREILADAARAAAVASVSGLAGCFPDVGGEWPRISPLCLENDNPQPASGASPVVEVFRADSVVDAAGGGSASKSTVQPEVVAAMLAAGLRALAGGAENPWPVLLPTYEPGQRIGLKVNCLNGYLPTSPALVRAIIASLRDELGVDPTSIVVWDRRLDELQGAGKYSANDLAGAQLVGTQINTDPAAGGPGYSGRLCGTVEGKAPRLSRILTEQTDLTINCPVLKRHVVSGITAALKNIYGIIDIPGDYHKNLNTALPALYALPPIRSHIRLTIVDALVVVANAGTEAAPDTVARRILLAQDPLAMDSYALALMNQLRAEKPRPLTPIDISLTGWLDEGWKRGLGTREYTLISA